MVYDHIKTEQLAKQVEARKKFLNLVVRRVIEIVRKYGRVTKRDQGSYHINVVSELRNFGNFTLETDLGQTDFGGDTVRIWYHPGRSFRKGGLDSAFDKEWTPVLDVFYQEKGDYDVIIFKKNVNWQKALLNVFKNKDRIANQIKKEQNSSLEKRKKLKQVDTKKAKLVADAQKLGILSEDEQE